MKYKKNANSFEFKEISKEQMVDIINSKHPIKLNKISYFADKIHERYPIATKTEIVMVLKEVFETIREMLVLGYVINFNKLFFDTKLYFFASSQGKAAAKIQAKTPPTLKK